MQPLVSIILPNYNHSRYLAERWNSIIHQSFQDFEIILLDDASTDDSCQQLHTFAKHPKVSQLLINATNSGSVFRQWNQGILHAKGKYIWIAESDDSCHPDFLQSVLRPLHANPQVGLAYSQSKLIDANSAPYGTFESSLSHLGHWDMDYLNSGKAELPFFRQGNTIPNASAVVFRAEIYHAIGGADESFMVCGDWWVWTHMLAISDVSFIHDPLNYYRTTPTNFRFQQKPEKIRQNMIDIGRIAQYLSESHAIDTSSIRLNAGIQYLHASVKMGYLLPKQNKVPFISRTEYVRLWLKMIGNYIASRRIKSHC